MRAIFLFFIALVTLISCKKNDPISNNVTVPNTKLPAINAVVVKNHVAFSSTKDIRNFFDLPDQARNNMIKKLEAQFTSFREYNLLNLSAGQRTINGCDVPDELIEDNDDFFSLLDSNGILQVGNDLFRYSYCDSTMYIISDTAALDGTKYSHFMSGNISDTNVRWFPTYVDGVDALDSGYRTMPDTNTVIGSTTFDKGVVSIHFPEDKRFADISSSPFFPTTDYMLGTIAYHKFFFYFSFFGKDVMHIGSTRDWYVTYGFQYKRKRQGNTSGAATVYPPASGPNKILITFYAGNRGLQKLYCVWNVFNYTNDIQVRREPSGTDYIGDFRGAPGYASNYYFNFCCFCPGFFGCQGVTPWTNYFEVNHGY